ncbi:MAG TPA: ACP synthase [Vicinamibacteria bacterium]|nr:ACP synthase [Vicinamibacteria bacterium]
MDHGVRGEATALVPVAEVEALGGGGPFTAGERAYASSKSDPARRLAARLAAKRAASEALGGIGLEEVEVVRFPGGPPRLRLGPGATAALHARGATRTMVSLTHGVEHAAAVVLLLA